MAFRNKHILNPVTGQEIRFLQTKKDTAGALLEMESTYHAHSTEPVPHYHPQQEEDFTVMEGSISVRLNGALVVLHSGDHLHIPKNTTHAMWNHTDTVTRVNWQVRPALDTEYLLEMGMGLANAGKVSAKGMPGLLQVVMMARRFSGEYRLARPPYFLQRILFSILFPVAYAAGYRGLNMQYID